MNSPGKQIYRFADIEVDTTRCSVTRGGQELHLRQQTFQVLVYLLEQKERLVTKEELLSKIWSGTAVTDDALVQCVVDIRKALGDDSRHPRFIKTVPKIGYRFINPAQVRAGENLATIETEEVTSVAFEYEEEFDGNEIARVVRNDSSTPQLDSIQLAPVTRVPAWPQVFSSRAILSISGVLVLGIGIATAVYFQQRSQRSSHQLGEITLTPVAGKKALAVMYFENKTGNQDLEWLREGLADMLITNFSRSNKLTVLSREQLQVLLDRIGHKESEKVQLAEALDVARRAHAELILLGSFAAVGEHIRIDVHIHDARNGELLTAERLLVDKREQILSQVDLLSLKLTPHLTAAEPEANTSLTSVMTNNLEAYRYYSLAVEKSFGLHNVEAITLLEKALALDPEFAMAYARIGYAHVRRNLIQEAKPYLEKAFQLSDRLTEKDKLFIAGWYSIANLDYANAIRYFQDVVARYPLEVEAYLRLATLLHGEERFQEAVDVAKRGLAVDAEAKELYNELGGIYLDLSRLDDALDMYKRYVELAPNEANAYDSLGLGYQWAGRYAQAIEQYRRALVLKPTFEVSIIHLGNTYYQDGQYQAAIQQYQRYIQVVSSDPERSRGYNSIAFVHRKRGKLDEAEKAARLAMKYDRRGVDQLFLLTLERGDLATSEQNQKVLQGWFEFNRGARGFPREKAFYRGIFDLRSGQSASAIENFKEALKHRPLPWSHDSFEDCLANAYLELGRYDEAIAEYERILKLNPNYPLVHFHLAQAYERKGWQDQARASYKNFLQVWKDAEADVPEVVFARKALAYS